MFFFFVLLGYGDIVPKTLEGKIFTLAYAMIGIPIFMWYIVKLGVLFRLLFMKAFYIIAGKVHDEFRKMNAFQNIMNRCVAMIRTHSTDDADENSNPTTIASERVSKQFKDDKRFHPSIIGKSLLNIYGRFAKF